MENIQKADITYTGTMSDVRKLDLNFLTVFEAMYRERSVTGAAHHVGLSQPATSSALGRMRRLFADPLFVRTSRGMVPTPLADEIAPAVREALETVRHRIIERSVVEPASAARTLRLSVSDASGLAFLPRLVRKLQHAAPLWHIETESLQPADLPRALEAGEFDLAVGNLDMLRAGIYRQRLISTEYKVIHRRDHPRFRKALTLADYLDAQHAIMRVPGSPPSALEQTLAKRGHARTVALSVPQFLLLPAIVAETDLVATVPAHVARAFAGPYRLAVWPLPLQTAELVLYQYWHRRYNADASNKWVRGVVRDLFGGDWAG